MYEHLLVPVDGSELSERAKEYAPGWRIPVLTTVAQTGEGIAELAAAILQHGTYLRTTDRLQVLEIPVLAPESIDVPHAVALLRRLRPDR